MTDPISPGAPSSQGRYRGSSDLLDRIVALEKRLSVLERTPQLLAAAVNSGGITITGGELLVRRADDTYPDGPALGNIQVGSNVSINGENGMALAVQRSDTVPSAIGTPGQQSVLITTVDGSEADPSFTFPTILLKDKSGDTIFSDTWNARRGIAKPELSYGFGNSQFTSSTSGTFTQIMTCEWFMYHPHFRIRVLVLNDGGNSSELRVSESFGNPNLLTVSVAAGASAYVDCVIKRSATVSGDSPNGNIAIIALEHRRTAGAGTIRSQVISCVGMDLSPTQDY